MRLGNLTLHAQDGRSLAIFAAQGFEVEPAPQGVVMRAGWPPAQVHAAARAAVERAVERGVDGVLLGGSGELTVYLHAAARAAGLPCYTAVTRRDRTPDGEFRYVLLGLREITLNGNPKKERKE